MTTAQSVIEILESRGFRQKRNGEWNGNNPFDDSSDSKSFNVRIEGDEWGCFHYFAGNGELQKGSLYELARKLGIEPVYHVNGNAPISKAEYTNLEDYASKFGIGAYEAFQKAGWTDIAHNNKRAIRIPVPSQIDNIAQIRYLESSKSKFTWERSGTKGQVWYGLNKAIKGAKDGFIVLCNGAPSVVIADMWGVPVFSQIGGESAIEDGNLRELITLLEKHKLMVAIALDCDAKGKNSSEAIRKQLGDRSIVIDLALQNKQDLGDYCRLWGAMSYDEIYRQFNRLKRQKKPITAFDSAHYIANMVSGEITMEGRYLPFPFTNLHQFGGGTRLMQSKLLTGFVGVSGGGKTSCMESGVEYLLSLPSSEGRPPYGILWDGREFSPEVYHIRRCQRYLDQIYNEGKPSQFAAPHINSDDILDWIVWQNEANNGVPEHNRLGKQPTQDDMRWLRWVTDKVERWHGHLEYIPQFDYLEQTLEYMTAKTIELRKTGQAVDLWVFDYINIYRLKRETLDGSQENIYNVALQTIKDAIRQIRVHCWVGIQTNKQGTNDMRQRNKRLAVADMRFVNDMHLNTIIALNLLYEPRMLWDDDLQAWYKELDHNGDEIIDVARLDTGNECGIWEILKNSFGRTGVQNMQGDLRHFRYLDCTWSASDKRYASE